MPIEISTVAELQAIENDLLAPYVLVNDIDATDTVNWNSGAGFAPLGNFSTPFEAHFNGNSHAVDGLFISRPSDQYVGLFGALGTDAVIERFACTAADIEGLTDVGIACGWGYYGRIQHCFTSGNCAAQGNYVGGIVGRISTNVTFREQSLVADCMSVANIEQYASYAGGIVGRNDGEILRCVFAGTFSGTSSTERGGLAGAATGDKALALASFWDTDTTGELTSPGGGTGKTTSELNAISTFHEYSITTERKAGYSWVIKSQINGGYPVPNYGYSQATHPIIEEISVLASKPDNNAAVGGTSHNFTFDIPTGANRLIVCACFAGNFTSAGKSVTFESQSLTLLSYEMREMHNSNSALGFWELIDPPTGPGSGTIVGSGEARIEGFYYALSGVDSIRTFAVDLKDGSTGLPMDIALEVPSQDGDLVIMSSRWRNSGDDPMEWDGVMIHSGNINGQNSRALSIYDYARSTQTTISGRWSDNTSNDILALGVAFAPQAQREVPERGVALRLTEAFVADGPEDEFSLYGEAYPVARGGLVFGYVNADAAGAGRDRDATGDPRLAGLHQVNAAAAAPSTFRVDLPRGSGQYEIRLAGGDQSFSTEQLLTVYDGAAGATTVMTYTGTLAADEFVDAFGTVHTSSAAWVTNNTSVVHDFTNDYLTIEFGDPGGTGDAKINYISLNTTTSSVTITTISDSSLIDGQTGVIITGTGFGT